MSVMRMFDKSELADALCCPQCGYDYLHQHTPTTYERGRTHGLALKFNCEGCDGISELAIVHSKGQTFLGWRIVKPKTWQHADVCKSAAGAAPLKYGHKNAGPDDVCSRCEKKLINPFHVTVSDGVGGDGAFVCSECCDPVVRSVIYYAAAARATGTRH